MKTKKWAPVHLKCYLQNVFTNYIYFMYMYKEDLALSNLQGSICHKTHPNMAQSAGVVEYTDGISAGVNAPQECPRNDTKQSDSVASKMLELWGMCSTPSLPSLPGSHRSRVVAPERVLSRVSNRTVWHLNWEQTNYWYLIELLGIDLFDDLCVNKRLMFNWIFCDT